MDILLPVKKKQRKAIAKPRKARGKQQQEEAPKEESVTEEVSVQAVLLGLLKEMKVSESELSEEHRNVLEEAISTLRTTAAYAPSPFLFLFFFFSFWLFLSFSFLFLFFSNFLLGKNNAILS